MSRTTNKTAIQKRAREKEGEGFGQLGRGRVHGLSSPEKRVGRGERGSGSA